MSVVDALQEAGRYGKNVRAFENGKAREFKQTEVDLKALYRVLQKELPLVVHIDRASDIETVLSVLDGFDIDLILASVVEGWKVRSLLAEKGVPVVVNVLDNRPSSFDKLGARLDNVALMAEAGVKVALMSVDPFSEFRSLSQAAGVAVAYGLPWQEALKTITVNPAEIWGLTGLGRIEEGGIADLVLWDGDPLEVMSRPLKVMVDGKWMDLTTRQDLLKARYSDLTDQEVPFGYR